MLHQLTNASHQMEMGTSFWIATSIFILAYALIVTEHIHKSGNPISFKKFLLYGMPFMIQTVIISIIYVWLRYFVLKI